MKKIEIIQEELKGILSEKRYLHSLGVMKMAKELAILYNVNPEIAALTGLTHDIAKEIPDNEKVQYCIKNNIEMDQIERIKPALLHGKIGADIVRKKYGFSYEMCKAIEYHTTMHPKADKLAKIIFIADKVDETRTYPKVDMYRSLARKDLDECVIAILDFVIKKNIKLGRLIHQNSVKARNKFLINKN